MSCIVVSSETRANRRLQTKPTNQNCSWTACVAQDVHKYHGYWTLNIWTILITCSIRPLLVRKLSRLYSNLTIQCTFDSWMSTLHIRLLTQVLYEDLLAINNANVVSYGNSYCRNLHCYRQSKVGSWGLPSPLRRQLSWLEQMLDLWFVQNEQVKGIPFIYIEVHFITKNLLFKSNLSHLKPPDRWHYVWLFQMGK